MGSGERFRAGRAPCAHGFGDGLTGWQALVGPSERRIRPAGWPSKPCPAASCRLRQQLGDADQVVGGERHDERHADPLEPAKLGLAAAAYRLQPAENLLDSFTLRLSECIAGVPGLVPVDRRAPPRPLGDVGVLGDVRRDLQVAQLHDQAADIIALVGTQRLGAGWQLLDQVQGCRDLGGAPSPGQHAADRQPIAVLRQHVASETEPAGLAVALAEHPCVAIGGRGMRRIRVLLASEARRAVATQRGWRPAAILRAKTLHQDPSLDQGAIDGKVLVGEQRYEFGAGQHASEELGGDRALQQSVAVLGEHGHVLDRIVDAQPDKPAEQQVVVELLHQLPLGAHRVERPQQLLRRDRRPPVQRIEPLEHRRQARQEAINQGQHRPKRVPGRHPDLTAHAAEQIFRPPIRATHPQLQAIKPGPIESGPPRGNQRVSPQPVNATLLSSASANRAHTGTGSSIR